MATNLSKYNFIYELEAVIFVKSVLTSNTGATRELDLCFVHVKEPITFTHTDLVPKY